MDLLITAQKRVTRREKRAKRVKRLCEFKAGLQFDNENSNNFSHESIKKYLFLSSTKKCFLHDKKSNKNSTSLINHIVIHFAKLWTDLKRAILLHLTVFPSWMMVLLRAAVCNSRFFLARAFPVGVYGQTRRGRQRIHTIAPMCTRCEKWRQIVIRFTVHCLWPTFFFLAPLLSFFPLWSFLFPSPLLPVFTHSL